MDIVGKIIQVLPLQEGVAKSTGNPWKIQSYVLETQEQYPKKICFEIFGEDRINSNKCALGDVVTVSFDIESTTVVGSLAYAHGAFNKVLCPRRCLSL